jgi:hypothetical protein
MSINKYSLLSKFPKKEASTENVIDLIYSTFSFKLINNYSINYLKISIFDTLNMKNISYTKARKINEAIKTNNIFFHFEYLYWNIFNLKYKQNQNNLLLPKKVYELKELHYITEQIIISYYKAYGKKITPDIIKKIQKSFFEKMKFVKILPFLEKNHIPPLASLGVFKSYNIKNKKNTNIYSDEEGTEYYLYRKNDIISKLPVNYFTTGFTMSRIIDINYISVNLRQFITSKYNSYLIKRYTGNNTNLNNSIFYLLTYYTLNEFIDEAGHCKMNIPKITDNKLNNLYSKSIDLVGTPLSVPINKPYFGLFPDIEQYFGSLGSFYDVEPQSGIYSIQFPMSFFFIKNTLDSVDTWLNNATKNNEDLTFILWIVNIKDTWAYISNIHNILVPLLNKSKYTKQKYYYLYDNKATESNSSHIIYVLSSK